MKKQLTAINKNNLLRTALKRTATDPSALTLILSNLIIIVWAVLDNWQAATIIWIYWYQNIIIGIFTVCKALTLQNFSTKGVTINDQPVLATKGTKIKLAGFFTIHYGFFHLCYALVLTSILKEKAAINYIIPAIFLFFANHLFSFIYNEKTDREREINIGTVLFLPYYRIIPMHLLIIIGAILPGRLLLILFLLLKTAADIAVHLTEHNKPR